MHPVVTHALFTFRHPVVRKGGIALAVSFSIFITALLFSWYPSSSKHHEIEQDIGQLRNKLIEINKLNELSSTYYAAEKTLDKVEKKLEASTSLAEFTNALYKLASKNNIQIISKSSHNMQIKQNYKILYQELTLQGKYMAMRQFILSLRDMPTWTLIKETRLKKKKGSNVLSGDFVLVSYQRKAGT
jgi:Tfp pilus assembly protein PilO